MELLGFIDIVVNVEFASLFFYCESTCDMLSDHDELGWAMS